DVVTGHGAAAEIAEEGPSGQRVVGVPPHRATVQGSPVGAFRPPPAPIGSAPSTVRTPGRPFVYTRTDISERYIGHIRTPAMGARPDVLELAILGLLKEQPLHGYELKKRLGETLGSLWGISYGSLYPALRRLEHDGSIESVEPDAF